MFKSKKKKVTITFSGIPGIFDYPKHLPLPQKGDEVGLNGKYGIVKFVKHITEGYRDVTEIRIFCGRL